MKGRRRNADEEQAACQTPFQFIEFSCDPLAHSSSSFLCQTKSSRPIRDESHSFVFPPNFIYPSPDIPSEVLSNPGPVSGAPGKTYCCFNLPNSEMHFSFLSISALTIRTRFAVFRRLLFSSSFRCVYFTTIRNACQQDFCKIFVYLKIQWPASILSICFSSTS